MVTLCSLKFSEATESCEERRYHRRCICNNDQARDRIVDLSRGWRGVVVLPSAIVGHSMELAVISGTTVDGDKPLSGLDLGMSGTSVVSRELALQDSVSTMLICRCANGRWKSCHPRLRTWNCQGPEFLEALALRSPEPESKPRDPTCPRCVMEAQPASFHTPPISQRQRQGFCQPVACRETSGARHIGQVLGGFHSTQPVPTLPNTVQTSGLRARDFGRITRASASSPAAWECWSHLSGRCAGA